MFNSNQLPLPHGTLCDVCQRPIIGNSGLTGEKVCQSFECIRLMEQKKTLPPQLFDNIFNVQSKNIREQIKRAKAEEERHNAIDIYIKKDDDRIFDEVCEDDANPLTTEAMLMSIASGSGRITELPERRRKDFEAYLAGALDEAFSDEEVDSTYYDKNKTLIARHDAAIKKVPELTRQTVNLCTQCRGGCCVAGGTKAFLEVPLLRELIHEKPGITPGDIMKMYMDYLPEQTIEGSCVFHTDKGCNLPFEIRSDVCNAFFCDPLQDYYDRTEASGKLPDALVISRNYRHFHLYDEGAEHGVSSVSVLKAGEQKLIDVTNL